MRGTHFSDMNAFVAVAEDASFTKAAKRTGLSVPSLSQSVRAIEERLGVRLLNRTTRHVALTEAGTHLLAQLQPLLSDLAMAMDSVNSFRDKPSGHLRLSVPPPVGHFLLAPILAGFTAQYPDITIEIVIRSSLGDIVAERFDGGVHSERFLSPDMIAVRMTPNLRRCVVASPDYLARRDRPSTPADLKTHNCIRVRLPDGHVKPWLFSRDGQRVEAAIRGSLVVNDPALEIGAAVAGLGLCYTSEQFVAPMLADGRLVSLFPREMMPEDGAFYLYYPSRRQNPAPLRALIDFLRNSQD